MIDKKKSKKFDLVGKIKRNPWKLTTFVFAVLTIVLIGSLIISDNSLSPKQAGENFVDYINSMGAAKIEYVDSVDFSDNLYQVTILAEGNEIPVHVTKDGLYFVQGVMPLVQQAPVQQEPETGAYSEEDLVKLREFSSCLAEKGIKIYGANWCGYTKSLAIDILGGFDIVGNAYIECTEEEVLCSQEGITGYPTIKFNGEAYQGARTLESLSGITGCAVPQLTGNVVGGSPSDVQCG